MRSGRAGALTIALMLGGCLSEPARVPAPPARIGPTTAPAPPGFSPDSVPDAVPRIESRSRFGNPPFYDVFGVRYYVLSSSADYVERGVASWYGPGFHKVRTSTGEPYDMYGMTAAHKTLPLPAYVRVTNLQNGRSIVVRVNDRGPFVGHRIIDLSYTAAAKLDMLRDGTAMVEVRSIDPAAPFAVPAAPPGTPLTASAAPGTPVAAPAVAAPPVAAPAVAAPAVASPPVASPPVAAPPLTAATSVTPLPPPLFIQAGAFADPNNAARLADRLKSSGYLQVFVRQDVIAGRTLYRVRIGPVPGVPEYDRIVTALEQVGVRDAHLALD